MIDFNLYKSILCLNGELPEAAFFTGHLPVIAADGAANTLMRMGISPQLVIGDLDSIEPVYRQQLKTHYHYDQDLCDFQKSLLYLQEAKLVPSIIVGVNGGYLDHIVNNINIFITTDSVLYAPPVYGFTLRENESKSFTVAVNTKLSLIGIPTAEISSQGLQWELNHYQMSFPGVNSCFNRAVVEEVHVTAHKGAALILIYGD